MHAVRTRRNADHDKRAADTEHSDVRIDVVISRYSVENYVELTGKRLKIRGIFRNNEMVSPEVFCILLLRRRGAEYGHIRAHRDGEFYTHVAEPAKSNDPDFLARASAEATQRRIRSDPRTHQWSH